MNGLLLDATDYTVTSSSVTLVTAANAGDELTITGMVTFEVADTYDKTTADARYVNASGDTMTGGLNVTGGKIDVASSNATIHLTDTDDTTYAEIRNNGGTFTLASDEGAAANNSSINFRVDGTERMRIDSAGRVTMPYQPAFRAHYSGGTIPNGTIIAWNSTDYNTGGHYSTSTGRFTAPIAGKYAFFVQVHHSSGSGYTAGHQYFDMRKNGVTFQRFIGRWDVDDWYELTTQTVVELNANDYVDVLVFSANNQWMGTNRPDHNHFTGYLIG
jgi:hypothetical protein